MSGFLISFEGPEGAGKTTQIERLYQYLMDHNQPVIKVREPGGTQIGDQIRSLLLNPENRDIEPRTEILLYAASRAELVEKVIQPALKKGYFVLCDRYIDSSVVYQGYGNQWNVQEVLTVNRMATGGLMPHRTYFLDVSVPAGQARLAQRGKRKDRLEQKAKEFHERVRQGYLMLARQDPKRIYLINTEFLSKEEVFQQLLTDFKNHFL